MDYEIILDTLKTKKEELEEQKNQVEKIIDDSNSSLSTSMNNPAISSLYSKLKDSTDQLKEGYKKSSSWFENYLTDLNQLESSLASFSCDGIDAPDTFHDTFKDIFKKVLIPTLKENGEKKDNKELSKRSIDNIDMSNYPTGDSREDGISRAVLVAKYLMAHGGFTAEQAAALAGVYIDENNCDPGEVMQEEKDGYGATGTGGNNYGAGIASWTFDKEISLEAAGFDTSTPIESLSMQQQCDMIIAETNTDAYKTYYDALKRCDNIEDASATAVVMIGAPGMSSNWSTHPTPAEAKNVSDFYGRSNDANFGPSEYHWNLDKRRLEYAKEVYNQL